MAYVYVRSGTTWTQQQKLVASDGVDDDFFGYSVSISGETAVIGAFGDDDAGDRSGSAYVFVRSGTTWTQEQKLTASDLPTALDLFGLSVCISDDTAVVGGITGPVYPFRRHPSPFAAFCDASDGALASCPCSNSGDPDAGCNNAQSTGGVSLDATSYVGSAGTARLRGTGFSTTAAPTVLVIRGTGLEASPVVFGDGLRCVGVPLVRFGATTVAFATSTHQVSHGAGPGVFHYQLWYRNTPATFCDPASAFNTSNGLSITWP